MSLPTAAADRLQSFQLFQGLSAADLAIVGSVLNYEKFPRNKQLIVQDESSTDVFFILAGRVRVEISLLDGKANEALATLGSGETVGELALARVARRTASAITQGDTEILACDAAIMNTLFEKHPAIGMQVFRNLTKVLASRLADTNMLLRNAVN